MRTACFFLLPFLLAFCSCDKSAFAPDFSASKDKSQQEPDPPIGQLTYWKWAEGDTVFQDTLVIKLEHVSFALEAKDKNYTYSFLKPIWNFNSLYLIGSPVTSCASLGFVSQLQKQVTFKQIK